jgi:hypothetical protein
MLNSSQLQNIEIPEFSVLYEESYISSHVEQIICLVLESAFVEKSKILRFDLSEISRYHHKSLIEKLKTRLRVSSIYISHNTLYIDWSL